MQPTVNGQIKGSSPFLPELNKECMLNGLDLFSGIGGLSIALSEWVRPVAYCEVDPYCQGVLLSRMANKQICNSPIWDDVRSLAENEFPPKSIDIMYGGFPCQDISIAGLGKGLEGERSGLFFEIVRLSKEIKPKFIFLENVPAITCRGGLRVAQEITALGYDCRWCVISAASIGALHKRDRWFLLAHADSESEHRLPSGEEKRQPIAQLHIKPEKWEPLSEDESPLLRVDDVIPFRMDRIRALGNAVVTSQAKEAFKILMGIHEP